MRKTASKLALFLLALCYCNDSIANGLNYLDNPSKLAELSVSKAGSCCIVLTDGPFGVSLVDEHGKADGSIEELAQWIVSRPEDEELAQIQVVCPREIADSSIRWIRYAEKADAKTYKTNSLRILAAYDTHLLRSQWEDALFSPRQFNANAIAKNPISFKLLGRGKIEQGNSLPLLRLDRLLVYTSPTSIAASSLKEKLALPARMFESGHTFPTRVVEVDTLAASGQSNGVNRKKNNTAEYGTFGRSAKAAEFGTFGRTTVAGAANQSDNSTTIREQEAAIRERKHNEYSELLVDYRCKIIDANSDTIDKLNDQMRTHYNTVLRKHDRSAGSSDRLITYVEKSTGKRVDKSTRRALQRHQRNLTSRLESLLMGSEKPLREIDRVLNAWESIQESIRDVAGKEKPGGFSVTDQVYARIMEEKREDAVQFDQLAPAVIGGRFFYCVDRHGIKIVDGVSSLRCINQIRSSVTLLNNTARYRKAADATLEHFTLFNTYTPLRKPGRPERPQNPFTKPPPLISDVYTLGSYYAEQELQSEGYSRDVAHQIVSEALHPTYSESISDLYAKSPERLELIKRVVTLGLPHAETSVQVEYGVLGNKYADAFSSGAIRGSLLGWQSRIDEYNRDVAAGEYRGNPRWEKYRQEHNSWETKEREWRLAAYKIDIVNQRQANLNSELLSKHRDSIHRYLKHAIDQAGHVTQEIHKLENAEASGSQESTSDPVCFISNFNAYSLASTRDSSSLLITKDTRRQRRLEAIRREHEQAKARMEKLESVYGAFDRYHLQGQFPVQAPQN